MFNKSFMINKYLSIASILGVSAIDSDRMFTCP